MGAILRTSRQRYRLMLRSVLPHSDVRESEDDCHRGQF